MGCGMEDPCVSEGQGKVDKEWFSLRTARAFNVDGQEYT